MTPAETQATLERLQDKAVQLRHDAKMSRRMELESVAKQQEQDAADLDAALTALRERETLRAQVTETVEWLQAIVANSPARPDDPHYSREISRRTVAEGALTRLLPPAAHAGDEMTRELCQRCGGNGVIPIPHGVSQCPRCHGDCYEPEDSVVAALRLRAEVAERVAADLSRLNHAHAEEADACQRLRAQTQHLREQAEAERDAAQRENMLLRMADLPQQVTDCHKLLDAETIPTSVDGVTLALSARIKHLAGTKTETIRALRAQHAALVEYVEGQLRFHEHQAKFNAELRGIPLTYVFDIDSPDCPKDVREASRWRTVLQRLRDGGKADARCRTCGHKVHELNECRICAGCEDGRDGGTQETRR